MRPRWYCDFLPLAGEGSDCFFLRNRLLTLLHGIFVRQPECFAIALPPPRSSPTLKGALRVFASTKVELVGLLAELPAQPWLRDYIRLTVPEQVPPDFAGRWTTFVRFRVPPLATDRHTDEAYGALHQRRLAETRQKRMEYFVLHSATTGQRFVLHIHRERGEAPQGECRPNSYGFSVSSRIFSLPDLSW